jgi:hypothetical protein
MLSQAHCRRDGVASGGHWFGRTKGQAKAAVGAVETGRHRSPRDPEQPCDRALVKVSQVDKYHDGAVLGGQRGDGSGDIVAVRRQLHRVRPDRSNLGPLFLVERLDGPAPAQLVDAGIPGDALQPRPDRCLASVAGQAPVRTQHRLLQRVIDLVSFSEHAPGNGSEVGLEGAKKLRERDVIAGPSLLQKNCLIVHGSNLRSGSNRLTAAG